MRFLAARFVRQSANSSHIVDPCLDLCRRFKGDEAFVRLKQNLTERKLNRMVTSLDQIRSDYLQWWSTFREFGSVAEISEKRVLRAKLLEQSNGILNALRLPNDLNSNGAIWDNLLPKQNNFIFAPRLAEPLRTCIERYSQRFLATKACEKSPVLLRRCLKQLLQSLFDDIIQPLGAVMPISIPHMVRHAVVEACNINLEEFPLVVEAESTMSLVGNDLPSVVAPLVKHRLPHQSNRWPLCFLAFGPAYHSSEETQQFAQSNCASLLVLDGQDQQQMLTQCALALGAFIENICLQKSLEMVELPPSQLKLYERSAAAIILEEQADSTGLLARFSDIGGYVSERAQITLALRPTSPDHDSYLQMKFLRINLDSILHLSFLIKVVAGHNTHMCEEVSTMLFANLTRQSIPQCLFANSGYTMNGPVLGHTDLTNVTLDKDYIGFYYFV